ncbi:MAG: UV DNA damage repair endonuclease UvsE [Firmicutes bacterium]|nr:UV DNA damage repair endonuclease UvsE [Bacillota bacterium]
MIIRFGYVAMSMTMQNASPSKTVTFKTYSKLAEKDPEAALNKVRRVTRQNLNNCLRLLRHNKAHGVHVYRFSSKIIPLGTHPELKHWDYMEEMESELMELGQFIRENKMRVTFHPDHFTVINTPGADVLEKSIVDLRHHAGLLEAMGLNTRAKLVMHVGGGYKNKSASLERFRQNWSQVPSEARERITLENDDKIYTGSDVLWLCEQLKLPMVLDIHHYLCNHGHGETLGELAPRFIDSWQETGLNPKIHVSSPKSEKNRLSHHDYVDPGDLYPFLTIMREHNRDFDVMVEAKQKDRAMFKLVQDLKAYPGIKVLGDALAEFV